MTPEPTGRDRARRGGVAALMLALFVVAVGIFLLPFAFPTPPPIVTRFQATQLFSPNSDGRRDEATVGVRLSEAGSVTIEIQKEGEPVIALLQDSPRPRGFFTTTWNGLDAQGRRAPDGTYALKLRARAGEKRFNTTRSIVVDTQAPEPAAMSVVSATLSEPGRGECRLSFTSHDAASVIFEAVRPGTPDPVRALGARPVRADTPVRWLWNGARAEGGRVAPGPYVIRASLFDAARNRVVRERTCWVGFMSGRATPARPAPRQPVRVSLRATGDGAAIAPSTRVSLVLRRRLGVPGETGGTPLGDQVGPGARGPAGRVAVRVPRGINPGALWLVATTLDGRASALIDLRGGG